MDVPAHPGSEQSTQHPTPSECGHFCQQSSWQTNQGGPLPPRGLYTIQKRAAGWDCADAIMVANGFPRYQYHRCKELSKELGPQKRPIGVTLRLSPAANCLHNGCFKAQRSAVNHEASTSRHRHIGPIVLTALTSSLFQREVRCRKEKKPRVSRGGIPNSPSPPPPPCEGKEDQ